MSSVPTIKKVAWISIVPHMAVMGVLILLWFQVDVENPLLFGVGTYLILSISLRTVVSRDHRKGMNLVKQERFNEAVEFFEKSYTFFKNNDWVDKYRYLAVLNSSKISFKEMALNNIAFCYGQLGDGEKAKEYYERTLHEFPDSGIARAGLRLLNSGAQQITIKTGL